MSGAFLKSVPCTQRQDHPCHLLRRAALWLDPLKPDKPAEAIDHNQRLCRPSDPADREPQGDRAIVKRRSSTIKPDQAKSVRQAKMIAPIIR